MTYLEAITEDLQPYPVRKSLIERQCVKHSFSLNDDVSDESNVTLCVIEILSQMVTLNNVSEGGVSLSFNKEAVNKIIKRKCSEVGIDYASYIIESTVTRLE